MSRLKFWPQPGEPVTVPPVTLLDVRTNTAWQWDPIRMLGGETYGIDSSTRPPVVIVTHADGSQDRYLPARTGSKADLWDAPNACECPE